MLHLAPAGGGPAGKIGELLCCAYTPDGAFIVTGGWDGHLRVWQAEHGGHVTDFQVSDKPVSACAVSPDGKSLASGSLDGLLALWDTVSHQPKIKFLAHTRPVSAIVYAPGNSKTLVTSSWDNVLTLWVSLGRVQESRPLGGHRDIVAGCRWTPDGQGLLSWAHDCGVTLWDPARGQALRQFGGHRDRVLAGAISPDGRWAATGGRDGALKLWDLASGAEVTSDTLPAEIRGCAFLLDGQHLVVADKNGRLVLLAVPSLQRQETLDTRLPVQTLELSPTGAQLALPCTSGSLRLVNLEGYDENPMLLTATRVTRRTATRMQKLFGRSQLVYVYECVCPACRNAFDAPPEVKPGGETDCPLCKRALQLSTQTRTAPEGAG